MRRCIAVVLAALGLSACSDLATTPAGLAPTLPADKQDALESTQWTIFTTQTPSITWTANSVEVGTRFKATGDGCIIGFRFWRAAGETGTHTIKLWFDSGTLWTSATVTLSGDGTGWQYVYPGGFVCPNLNEYYRVSVNTNSKHVEKGATFNNGNTITNGPLTAVRGVYTQPAGSFPTYTSGVNFFVDVIFDDGFGF